MKDMVQRDSVALTSNIQRDKLFVYKYSLLINPPKQSEVTVEYYIHALAFLGAFNQGDSYPLTARMSETTVLSLWLHLV